MPDETTEPAHVTTAPAQATAKKTYFDSTDSADSEGEETPEVEHVAVKPVVTRVKEDDIVQAFKEQLGSLRTLTFTLLSRIEQRLCEKFAVARFDDLTFGTFTTFIDQHESLLFPVDMRFNVSSSTPPETKAQLVIPLKDVEEFIRQALHKSIDQATIEHLLCYHFHVESFAHLGHGSFRSVLDAMQSSSVSSASSTHYECILCAELPLLQQLCDPRPPSAMQDLEKEASDAVDRCPLLNDICIETQWNIRFRPHLGNLKSFLARHSVPVLEIDRSTLLKLSSHSTIDTFKESLFNYDSVQTAGHLVSILVQYDTVANAPLSLLANLVQAFYSSIDVDDQLYRFLRRVFVRIPFVLLSSIVQRIFLQALVQLEGSPIKVRQLLWNTMDPQDLHAMSTFVRLGEALGFTDRLMDPVRPSAPLHIKQEEQERPSVPLPAVPTLKVEPRSFTMQPKDFIQRIRREKFGVGIDLSNEGQHLTDQLKSLVGRSLERLSKELYNSDMHFVLELIQNADDNQYVDKPALVFIIDQSTIQVYNNELGFQEENIQALCDIGRSTKGKHKQGYIGQKGRTISPRPQTHIIALLGIGFKSVFTVW